jgi:putative tricarboxylic transport membrane protein
METTSLLKSKAYRVIGIIGLVFSAGYLGLSFQLPFGRLDETGAAVFPVFVGILLILSSLAILREGWRLCKETDQIKLPSGADGKRMLKLVAYVVGYLIVLPWLGQLIASTLLCIFMIRIMTNLGWLRIVVYSLAITITLQIIFVVILKVPMPHGALPMPSGMRFF